jgi:hypothetical protein
VHLRAYTERRASSGYGISLIGSVAHRLQTRGRPTLCWVVLAGMSRVALGGAP